MTAFNYFFPLQHRPIVYLSLFLQQNLYLMFTSKGELKPVDKVIEYIRKELSL